MFIWLTFWLSQCLSIWIFVCPSAVIVILTLLSHSLRLQGFSFFFFFSYQKPTDFNRKRLNLYTQKLLYLHLTLNVLDDWYQTIDSMRVSPYYYPTAQSKVQISCDIVRSFGQLVILYCKKTLLYSLCFSRHIRNEQKNLAEQKAVE